MTVIIFARPSADLDTMPASSAYSIHAPNFPSYACQWFNLHPVLPEILLEVNQVPKNVWVLTEAYQNGMYHSNEDIENKQSLSDVKPLPSAHHHRYAR